MVRVSFFMGLALNHILWERVSVYVTLIACDIMYLL